VANQKALVVVSGTTQQIVNGDTLAVGAGVDSSVAGTLSVGASTANAITIGKVGVTTSFPGPVALDGDVTTVGGTQFTTDAQFDGNVTFGNAATDNVSFVGQIDTAITQEGIAAPAVSPASTGRIYFDSGTNTFKASQNGGAYVDVINSATPGGGLGDVQLNDGSGNFTGNTDLTFASNTLTVTNTVDVTNGANTLTVQPASIGSDAATLTVDAGTTVQVGGVALVNISGAFTLPGVDGANGQVLTTDGAGTAAWQTPSGGATAQGGANAVQYANATTPADFDGNANFVYDEATGRLGIGTASPSTTLHVNSGAVNGTAIATLQNTAGDFQVFRVDANPEGSVTGSIGDIADDSTNGVVYVKTSGSATNTGWSPLANLGTKVYLVVEGGQYPTIQAAIDATPTGTNVVPAYSVILVGPKANTGGGASGSWGPAVLAANKSLMIAGLGGAQTAKDIRIDSLTFDSSAAGLNANINENYVSGLYIISSSASSVVTFGGTGAIRLRLNNCYVVNTGAGDAVTNTNSNVSGSLYLDTCTVSAESTTGIAVRSSGTYTTIRNRSDISTTAGGTNLSTGRSVSASAGVVEIYDSFIGGAGVPRPIVELTGTAFLSSGYTTISNPSNDTNARCVFVNSATATFASGDASLALGSSVAVAGQVVSGAGTFAFGNITFSFSPLLTVTTQTPVFRTGGWFTTDIREGISLTSPGSPLFNLNSSGRITRYNDAAPTNGQLLIGDTAAGYFKSASLTAGSGVTITPGAGSVTIAATGVSGSGTATQIAYFTGASAIGSETAVGSNSFTWDATNNRLGVGTAAPANVVDVQAGALNSGQSALSVTGTLSSTVATQRGVTMFVTGAGSGAQQIEGVIAGLSGGGYTGTGSSIGANFYNESLGTGNQPFAQVFGNVAVRGQAYGATATGHNVGFYATAQNALRNFGFLSVQNTSSQANGYNVGVATSTHNAAASGVRVGGFFSIDTTFLPAEPTLTSAALIADNTSTTDPIFLARDSGTTTFSIGNNGVVLAKNTADTTTAFSVQDSGGTTLLGIDTVNDRVGVGGVAGASLTHTFNVGAAGAANFCVASGGRIHTYAGSAPTNGQVLIGDGVNGHFDKATITAGTGIAITNGAGTISIAASNAGGVQPITTIGVTTTLDGTNYTVLCSATLTVNLPAAASNTGRIYNIKNIGAAATITIDPNGAETIDGAATYTLTTQYESVTLQCNGTAWFIL